VPSLDFAALTLLVAKIVVCVGFVLIGTAAAERLGPRLGGLFASTPQMSVVSPSPLLLAARAAASALTVVVVTSLAHLLGPKWSGLIVAFPVNTLPVIVILHWHYGSDVIKPFIKRFPSGVFGVCLFNLVAFLWLERLGLPLTVALAYGVDIAYVALVGWLSRPRIADDRLPAPAP